jgi:protein-disulfide isomerase
MSQRSALDKRRKRTLWTVIIAVVVLVVAAIVGFSVYNSQRSKPVATPKGTVSDGGTDSGLAVAGNGPVRVEVYLDFLCPACKSFETNANATLDQFVSQNRITLIWHTLGFLDSRSTTNYSTRSAAAAGCASDFGQLKAYGNALFASQPPEGSAGLSADQLIDLGGPAGLNSPAFAACVRDQKYKPWVGRITNDAARRGVNATPTLFINGKETTVNTVDDLKAAINAAG